MNAVVVTLSVDEDWMRLVTYRWLLREIAQGTEGEGWKDDPHAEAAREALALYGDLEPNA